MAHCPKIFLIILYILLLLLYKVYKKIIGFLGQQYENIVRTLIVVSFNCPIIVPMSQNMKQILSLYKLELLFYII